MLAGSCAPTLSTAAHFIVAEFAQHSILLLWVVELGATLICGKGGVRCQRVRASTQDHTRRVQIPNSDLEMLSDPWDPQAPNSQILGTLGPQVLGWLLTQVVIGVHLDCARLDKPHIKELVNFEC